MGKRHLSLRWSVVGAIIIATHALWSLAIPLTASPDEQSHIVRAAAVARGQWSGELGPVPADGSVPGAATVVRLPSDYLAVLALPNCFAFQPEQSASCQQGLPPAGTDPVDVETFAGQYPPLYYALVGWPSLLLSAGPAIYAMRLISGAIASLLLLWGVVRSRDFLAAPPATWAVLAAITPMCLFLGASVNPQALEISAGFAFWAACLALVRSSGPPRPAALIQAGVAGALLINSRASGPVWAVGTVILALAFARPGRVRVLWSARGTRWTLAAGAGAGALAAIWIYAHGGVVTATGLHPEYGSPTAVIHAVLSLTDSYLQQMVGDFGWLDAPSPWLTTIMWFGMIGALLLLALALSPSGRDRTALLLGMVAVIASPVALQIPAAADTGIIWQGRYILPLAVGVPMMAAATLADVGAPASDVVRRICRWVIPVLAIAQVAAFWSAARRYSEGSAGQWLTLSPQWSSPVGYLPGVLGYALLIGAATAIAWRAVRGRAGLADEGGAAGGADPPSLVDGAQDDSPKDVVPAYPIPESVT